MPSRPTRVYLAIAALFFVNGTLFASWVARIPTVAQRLGLDNAEVGLALLGVGLGSLAAFPFVGRFIDRFGSGRVSLVCGLAACAALLLPSLMPGLPWLFAALAICGAAFGAMDVAMNAQGVEGERTLARPIMNSLHGFFSLGGFAGAALGGLVASLGVGVVGHFAGVAMAAALLLLVVQGWLVPDLRSAEQGAAPVFMLPPRALGALGAIALCSFMAEGAMADWSALYLHASLGAGEGTAAAGFAVFSLAMLAGRFSGDRLVTRFGAEMAVRTGAAVAALGLAFGLALPTLATALIGFGLVGLGLSVVVPSAFSAAGAHPTIPGGTAIAAVATMGYAGFLAGPPTLGLLAEGTSLRLALVVVVVLCAAIVVLSPAVRRRSV